MAIKPLRRRTSASKKAQAKKSGKGKGGEQPIFASELGKQQKRRVAYQHMIRPYAHR